MLLHGKEAVLRTVTEELNRQNPDWVRISIALNALSKWDGFTIILRHTSERYEPRGNER